MQIYEHISESWMFGEHVYSTFYTDAYKSLIEKVITPLLLIKRVTVNISKFMPFMYDFKFEK